MSERVEPPVPASLREVLRARRDRILEDWTARVRALPVAARLPEPRLVDHLPELLDAVALALEDEVLGRVADPGRLHALDRLNRGFDVGAMIEEYALLRACVLDACRRELGPLLPIEEVARFDRIVDSTLKQAVEYSAKQRQRVLVALDRIATATIGTRPLADLLRRLLEVFIEASAAADTSSILLYDEADGRLRVRASIGLQAEVENNWSLPPDEGFAGRVFTSGGPVELRNAAEDPLVRSPYIRAARLRALYGVPLALDGRVMGVAHMGSRTAWEFSDEDKALFRTLASRATQFIHEQLLREEAERRNAELEAVIAAIPDGFYMGDARGVHLSNATGRRLLGLDALDQPIGDLVAALQIRRAANGAPISTADQPFMRALRGESVVEELLLRNGRTGEDVYLRSAGAPIRLHGRIIGAVTINTDITARHLAERALAQARANLDLVLGHVPLVLFAIDREGRYTLVEGHGLSALGLTSDELVGKSVFRAFAGEPEPLAAVRHGLGGEIVDEVITLRERDLSFQIVDEVVTLRERGLSFQIFLAPIESGGVAGVAIDVTSRRRAELERLELAAEVDRERRLLREVLRQVPTGVAIVETDGESIVLYNEEAARIWREPLRSVRLQEYREGQLFDRDGRLLAPSELPLARALHQGVTLSNVELRMRRGDGSEGWLLINSAPILDERGRVLAAVAAFVDITERKETEAELQRESFYRERFMAILGHDLRNPLSAITMAAQLLTRQPQLPANARRVIDRILSSAHRTDAMIRDLLDLTRARAGTAIPMTPAPMDLGATCREVIDELMLANPGRVIDFEQAGDARGVWDPERMVQVISNLCTNALRYSPPESAVRVKIEGERARVRLAVHNSGEPIPPEALPHLFDPFRRAVTAKGHQQGLGLGLFIVRTLVEQHGGCISVRSSAAEGTTFTVELPR